MSDYIVPTEMTITARPLIDLIAATHHRQRARAAYGRVCREEQQRQERARQIGDLHIYIGYNFGQAAEQALNLRCAWSDSDTMPIACFDHASQTYTISLSDQVWFIGKPDHLRCYGDASGINNRDLQIEHVQARYDRLRIQIGHALDMASTADVPDASDLPF